MVFLIKVTLVMVIVIRSYPIENSQCKKFFICTRDGAGKVHQVRLLCPRGTTFNLRSGLCDNNNNNLLCVDNSNNLYDKKTTNFVDFVHQRLS